MALTLLMIFLWVPTEINQGNIQRSLYFHVPVAWIAMIAIVLIAVASVAYLKTRDEKWDRLAVAGIHVDEAGLTHLAYAAEIAGAMLRRQQADAVIAARKKVVIGAVSMVEDALAKLSSDGLIELDDERKAAMVSNLMVVLCGDREAQPVVNAGTLYQ